MSPRKAPRSKPVRRKPAAKRAPARAREEAEFLARAWTMEVEAAERYLSFADALQTHNNREVAELFRKLARIEQMHADQILEQNLAMHPPVLPPGGMRWDAGREGPETADPGELHYRMQPYHALQVALGCERRAQEFFAGLARNGPSAAVRKAAREMAAEEAEHVRLIEDWLARTPPPDKDWQRDPDPPVLSD
jgi:rubrerythrin